jgi:hypothetical protein
MSRIEEEILPHIQHLFLAPPKIPQTRSWSIDRNRIRCRNAWKSLLADRGTVHSFDRAKGFFLSSFRLFRRRWLRFGDVNAAETCFDF